MNVEDVKGLADEVSARLSSLECLLRAVNDRVRFYLLADEVYGPYKEIVHSNAKEIQGLLAIMENIVSDANSDLRLVIRSL